MTRSRQDWSALADGLSLRTHAFVDGRPVAARDGRTRPTVAPASGKVLADVADCGRADVDAAVTAARRAFDDGRWSRQAPVARRRVLLALADLIERHHDEFALLDSLDAGKLIADTYSHDVPGSAAVLRWYAETVDKVYGEVAPAGPGDLALVRREPLGVVAAVVPWNFPLEIAVWKIAPALAAGNSVVLKPSEESPLSALLLAELGAEAGLPDGVLNVVPGDGPVTGRALGEHPDVDVLTFTGSTAVGKLFLSYAGRSNMKQVWLECGGKSANVVLDDAGDLDAVADGVCTGIFTNAGQVCSANSRLVVHRAIKDALVARVVERAREWTPGDPLDAGARMGPLVSSAHAGRVREHLSQARQETVALLDLADVPDRATDAFVGPSIFDCADPAAAIATEEVFGPALAVLTVDDEDDAIRVANATAYGLAASLWTDSLSRAHRIAPRLRAGTVSVNTVDALDPTTPFGGFGRSGFGRDLSLHALDKFTGLKTTWIRHG